VTKLSIRTVPVAPGLVRVRTETGDGQTVRYVPRPEGPSHILRLLQAQEPAYESAGVKIYIVGEGEQTQLIVVKQLHGLPKPAA
jgi:hypothetical protein